MKSKKITTMAMLCAIAYIMTYVARIAFIPVVPFLKYDPKDIIITLGGLMLGPVSAFIISAIVAVLELFTNSSTGIWGCVMNIISSCSFACTAAFIYKKKHTIQGAVAGLITGVAAMTLVMLLWNYLITPIYMGLPREAVAELLIPAFLPFNLIKGGLNAGITFFLYKPVITALRRASLLPPAEKSSGFKKPVLLWVACGIVILTCILVILSFMGFDIFS